MQRYLVVFCMLFSITMTSAQSVLRKQKKENLWGYINQNDSIVIAHQYQNCYDFYENIALVQKENLWGFIDNDGQVVVPFQFSKVKKLTSFKVIQAEKNGRWYLLDLSGKLLNDTPFDTIYNVNNGKIPVVINDKMGLLATDGQMLLKAKYQELTYYGRDMVRVKKRDKYGYRTTDNKRAVPIKYEELGQFYGSRVKAKRKGKWGMIDKKGKEILKNRFDYIGEFSYDTYLKDYYAPYVYGTSVGKISSWGASVPFEYEEIVDAKERIDDNLIRIRFGNDYGAVDNNGKVVIVPAYKNAFTFNEGYAAVTDGNKYGFIDKKGVVVVALTLDYAENFEQGQAKVIHQGKDSFISASDLIK